MITKPTLAVADARNALDNRVRQIRGAVPASFVETEVNDLIAAVRRAAFLEAASKLGQDAKFGHADDADPGEPLTVSEGAAFERAALRVGAMS